MSYHCCFESPMGLVTIEGDNEGILSIKTTDLPEDDSDYITDEMNKCRTQLEEYFEGMRTEFDLKLAMRGTDFQKCVWEELTKIPYGKTVSYKDIAEAIGRPRASRAVGGATNRNSLWIVVPCHRVIGADGSMVGYGGEIWKKVALLKFEKDNLQRFYGGGLIEN